MKNGKPESPEKRQPLPRGVFGELLLPAVHDLPVGETPLVHLAKIIGGEWESDTDRQIYRALVVKREPVSLISPLFSSSSNHPPYRTFVPILTRLSHNRWKVGQLGHGRLKIFDEPEAGKAIAFALSLIARWHSEEELI